MKSGAIMELKNASKHLQQVKIPEELIVSLRAKISDFVESTDILEDVFSVWKKLRANTIGGLKDLNLHANFANLTFLSFGILVFRLGCLITAVFALAASYLLAISLLVIGETVNSITQKGVVDCIQTNTFRHLDGAIGYLMSDYLETKELYTIFEKHVRILQDIVDTLQKVLPSYENWNYPEKPSSINFGIAMEYIDYWLKRKTSDETFLTYLSMLRYQCVQHRETLNSFLKVLHCEDHPEQQVHEFKTVIGKLLEEKSKFGIFHSLHSLVRRFLKGSEHRLKERMEITALGASIEKDFATTLKYSEISKKWRDIQKVLVKKWIEWKIQQLKNSLTVKEEYLFCSKNR